MRRAGGLWPRIYSLPASKRVSALPEDGARADRPASSVGEHPRVAIIVLNWNGWRDTLECLASVRALDYPNFEVILVDNGSTDESVSRLQAANPEITLIEAEENRGFSGGNNLGIRYAMDQGARFVWLLNNDTRPDSGALSTLVDVAAADPNVAAVGSVLYSLENPDRVQAWGGGWVSLWWGVAGHHRSAVRLDDLHYLTGASLLLRCDALAEVGLLDEAFFLYWEDTDLSFRLRHAGWKLAVAPRSRVLHRQSASTAGNYALYQARYETAAAQFFRRHARVPIIPILVGPMMRRLAPLIRRGQVGP